MNWSGCLAVDATTYVPTCRYMVVLVVPYDRRPTRTTVVLVHVRSSTLVHVD